MKKFKTLYVTERREWRKWLEINFDREKEIWLVYPNKSSGKSRILYNDAVEEALCFGWIDNTVKKFDKKNSMQRFSPRSPKSTYAQANKERLRWLLKKDMIHQSVKESVKQILKEKFIFPSDIIKAIKKDKKVWENYQKFSEPYKRIRVAYIQGARKRPGEFNKRLLNFINKTKENKLIGFGGIEKHY